MPFPLPARGLHHSGPLTAVERTFLVAALFLYWTDALRLAFPGGAEVSIAFRLVHFIVYGFFLGLFAWRRLSPLEALVSNPLLAAVLVLPLVSTLWSISPQETAQRAVALLGSSLIAIYLALRLDGLAVLRLIALTAALSAVVSFVLIAFVPSVGLMGDGEYAGVWTGVWVHKNGMGQMAVLGALACLVVLLSDGVARGPVALVGFGLNVALVAGSRSLTSQLVLAACIGLMVTAGPCLRLLGRAALPIAVVLLGSALMAAVTLSLDDIVDLLASAGKDATMSSRLPLWQILVNFMEGHAWLGFGYEAFWTEDNPLVRVIEGKLHFRPHYSHNGYIELWLGLGFIGFAMMAALLVDVWRRIFSRLTASDRDPVALFALAYGLTFLLQNTAEVTILMRNHMSWGLFVLIYLLACPPLPAQSRAARLAVV